MKRVLVVDDEPRVARSLRRQLAGEIDIHGLSDPHEALQHLRGDDAYDAVLCDMELGGSTGADFEAALRDAMPYLVERLIFISGGAVSAGARRFLTAPGRRRLEKPFELGALVDAINEVAAKRAAGTGRVDPTSA